MESKFIHYKSSRIHYRKSGSGKKKLVCLHGFGEKAESFDVLEKVCGLEYTIIAFDFPFHGLTEWKEGMNFGVSDLNSIIEICPESGTGQFYLLGYSMGGRMVLSYYTAYPGRILGLFLLAPDGLVVSGWYKLATSTSWGNSLFRSTMKNPTLFVSLLNFSVKLRLVNSSVTRFVRNQVNNAEMREMIYVVWTTMRSFKPDLHKIRKLIQRFQTPVSLVFGKYDRIIRAKSGSKLNRGVEQLVDISILESGHQLLDASKAELLRKIFTAFSERSRSLR